MSFSEEKSTSDLIPVAKTSLLIYHLTPRQRIGVSSSAGFGGQQASRTTQSTHPLLQLFSRYSRQRLKEWYGWALGALSDG